MQNQAESDWDACPSGLVGGLGKRLQRQRSRRRLLRATVAGTGAAAILLAGGLALRPIVRDDRVVALTCKETVRLGPGYRDRTLEPALYRSVVAHLKYCKGCRDHYREMGIDVAV